jgi:integrase
MKVFLRGKYWWGSWSIDGRRYRVSSGTSDEKLAKQVLAKQYAEGFREKTQGIVARKTWREASERYLHEHQHLKSYALYEVQSRWWTQQFERRKIVYVDQITPDEVRLIRDTFLAEPMTSRQGSTQRRPATVNRCLAYLRAVINAVFREYQWCGQSAPPLFRMLRGERARIRYITPEEFGRLLQYLPELHGRAARIAVATGLRQANVLGLRWDQVDMVRKVARIDGVLMKNGEALSIPLNEEAMDVLVLQRNDSEWVFPGRRPNLPMTTCAHRSWMRACEQAGIEDFHWHDLRHTWASWLRQRGATMDVIQQLGGWKSSVMVERYAHLSLDHLRGAAALVDSNLGRVNPEIGTNMTQTHKVRRHLSLVSA